MTPLRPHLFTVGHGSESREGLAALLVGAKIVAVVDVRSAPGSRRHPQFARQELGIWLPEAGITYRWEPDLGGFRRPSPNSPNLALHHPSFRGYADYMMTDPFAVALRRVADEAAQKATTVMCAETLWWRCHRRLIADAAALLLGAEVSHLDHAGHLGPHRLTEGARLDPETGRLVYDAPLGDRQAEGVTSVPGHPGPGPVVRPGCPELRRERRGRTQPFVSRYHYDLGGWS